MKGLGIVVSGGGLMCVVGGFVGPWTVGFCECGTYPVAKDKSGCA